MKYILDEILNKNEIEEFENLYIKIYEKKSLNPHQKKWLFWSESAKWADSLERKEDFLHQTVGLVQKEIMNGYKKIIMPLIKKGLIVSPILGTLLGLYRENNLIQHDDDLDLAVDIFSMNKLNTKLKFKSFFKGWKYHKFSWLKNNGTLSSVGDNCIRLYRMKKIKFQIGSYVFESTPSIDLWPMTKAPKNHELIHDREMFYIHLNNIYKKNNLENLFNLGKVNSYFKSNTLLNEKKDSILGDENSLSQSIKWITDFVKRSKESNEEIYIPLEKDMLKIGNLDLGQTQEITIGNALINLPKVDDSYFEKMYGDWKKPKLTHLHLIRIGSIKKVK